MKVIFKFSKKLGSQPVNEDVEMHSTTAAVLERKGFGSIQSKVISVKEGPKGGLEIKTAKLTKEDRDDLMLDSSLVKNVKREATE